MVQHRSIANLTHHKQYVPSLIMIIDIALLGYEVVASRPCPKMENTGKGTVIFGGERAW